MGMKELRRWRHLRRGLELGPSDVARETNIPMLAPIAQGLLKFHEIGGGAHPAIAPRTPRNFVKSVTKFGENFRRRDLVGSRDFVKS